MLRECPDHGYFRGETCPMCDNGGRFLMSTEELDRLGRIMAGVLRHFPQRFGLRMNRHGYVDINALVREVRKRRQQFHWMRPHHIRAIVITDPKGRYQVVGTKVRATYGHSIEVELDLPEEDIPDNLYYPTGEEDLNDLLENGITPSDRRDVHLSHSAKDAYVAGSYRIEVPIILEVDANGCMEDGIMIQKAGTTVYLTKDVPPKYLKVIEFDKSEIEEEEEEDPMEEPVGEAPMTEVPLEDMDSGEEPEAEPEEETVEEEPEAEPVEEIPAEEPEAEPEAEEPEEEPEAEPEAEEPEEEPEAEPEEAPAEEPAEEEPAEEPEADDDLDLDDDAILDEDFEE